MNHDLEEAIESTYASTRKIFMAFVKSDTKDPDFFTGQYKQSLDDLLNFLVYIENNNDCGFSVDILTIYNNSVPADAASPCERIVFLSVIGFFFARSETLHTDLKIEELLETYSDLIQKVLKLGSGLCCKLENKILRFSAYCLNQLMHKDASFIHGICKWVSTRNLVKECITFQGYLRWPKTNIEPSDRMMIAEAIVSMPIRGASEQDRIFKSVVFQTLRLYGVPESELLPAMSKLDHTSFYQECAFICFCSIVPSRVEHCFENIRYMFELFGNKHAVDSALSVIQQSLITACDVSVDQYKTSIIGIMGPLMSAVLKIGRFRASTRTLFLDILDRLYAVDSASMIESFSSYLDSGSLSAEMTRIACEYSAKKQFCCVTRQNCVKIADRFSRFTFGLLDDTESLSLAVQIIVDSIHLDSDVLKEENMKALLFILRYHPSEEIRNAISEFKVDLKENPDDLDKELLSLVLDLSMNFSKKSSFLTDAVVSIASRNVLTKVGIQERKLFDYIIDSNSCSSFKYTHPELVHDFIAMLDPEADAEHMTEAIEGLTGVAKQSKITLSLLEEECDFLSQFIDTNQDKDNLLNSLSQTFVNVALQILMNPDLEDIPEYVEFLYQMCLSGLNKNNLVLQDAVLLLFLAVYTYDVNHLVSIEDLVEVAMYIDREHWLKFLQKFEVLFPKQVDDMLKTIHLVVPGVVAEVLFDRTEINDPRFALFCFIMSENQEELLPKLNQFLEVYFPSVPPASDVSHVLRSICMSAPEIGPYLIRSAINYDNPKLQKRGQQMKITETILTILQPGGNKFQVTTSGSCNSLDIEDDIGIEEERTRSVCAEKMKTVGCAPTFSVGLAQESSDEELQVHQGVRPNESYSLFLFDDIPMLVAFALKVSRGEITNEEQVTAFWQKLMSNICGTIQVFDYLVTQNVDLLVFSQIFSLCQFKDELITKFEEAFASNVITYLCEQKFQSALICFAVISSRGLMNKVTVFACCLLIQLREVSLFCEAVRFLIQIGVFQEVPVRDIECLMTICSYLDKEELDSFIDMILESVERCTSIPYFRILCLTMFCAYCRFPSQSVLFNNSFFRLLIQRSWEDVVRFDALVASVYEVALMIEESRPLPTAIINQLVNSGFQLVDLGLVNFPPLFASLLELRKNDDDDTNRRIDSLLLKGDAFVHLGTNEYENYRIINGLQQLKDQDFERMKLVAVFGGKYLKRKLKTAILMSQLIHKDSHEMRSFVQFVSLSTEIDVVDRIDLLNTLSVKFGEIDSPKKDFISGYKKDLNEVFAMLQ